LRGVASLRGADFVVKPEFGVVSLAPNRRFLRKGDRVRRDAFDIVLAGGKS
jgi:hypothetical protein